MTNAQLILGIPAGLAILVMLIASLRLRSEAEHHRGEAERRMLDIEARAIGEVRSHIRHFQCAVLHDGGCADCPFKADVPPVPPRITQDVPEQPTPQATLPEARVVLRGKGRP